jgi:Proteasome assembly chaperone 4
MGPLVVAMPRTKYRGAFGTGSKEPSCSLIIGGESADDQMLASRIASNLTLRSRMPVFVSCELSSSSSATDSEDWSAGMDSETVSHIAAAIAEKEIWRILQEQRKSNVEGA